MFNDARGASLITCAVPRTVVKIDNLELSSWYQARTKYDPWWMEWIYESVFDVKKCL